jgi:hypothetical protein
VRGISILVSEMRSKFAVRGVTTRRIAFLIVSLVLIGSLTCLADQLQWNSSDVCERAVRLIRPESILISYCSLADNEHVEAWLVKRVEIVNTPIEGLFEVLIFGKCLYKSKTAFSSGEYREPIDYIEYKSKDQWGGFPKGIDLAYVYIHTGDNSFQCLGKVLGLECLVELERMNFPDDLMKKIIDRKNPLRRTNLYLI